MERDPAEDEIEALLRQPMGLMAKGVAWQWLQRYRTAPSLLIPYPLSTYG